MNFRVDIGLAVGEFGMRMDGLQFYAQLPRAATRDLIDRIGKLQSAWGVVGFAAPAFDRPPGRRILQPDYGRS